MQPGQAIKDHHFYSPLVKQTECEDTKCIFQDDYNEWCFYYSSAIMEAEWDIEQSTEDTDLDEDEKGNWSFKIVPKLTTAWYFDSSFNIDRLYENGISFYIDEFEIYFEYGMLFDKGGQVCLELGWYLGSIVWTIDLVHRFWNCNKTLINDLSDF